MARLKSLCCVPCLFDLLGQIPKCGEDFTPISLLELPVDHASNGRAYHQFTPGFSNVNVTANAHGAFLAFNYVPVITQG